MVPQMRKAKNISTFLFFFVKRAKENGAKKSTQEGASKLLSVLCRHLYARFPDRVNQPLAQMFVSLAANIEYDECWRFVGFLFPIFVAPRS